MIAGSVRDVEGKLVPNAVVSIQSGSSEASAGREVRGRSWGTRVDTKNGTFRAIRVPLGHITVSARRWSDRWGEPGLPSVTVEGDAENLVLTVK